KNVQGNPPIVPMGHGPDALYIFYPPNVPLDIGQMLCIAITCVARHSQRLIIRSHSDHSWVAKSFPPGGVQQSHGDGRWCKSLQIIPIATHQMSLWDMG